MRSIPTKSTPTRSIPTRPIPMWSTFHIPLDQLRCTNSSPWIPYTLDYSWKCYFYPVAHCLPGISVVVPSAESSPPRQPDRTCRPLQRQQTNMMYNRFRGGEEMPNHLVAKTHPRLGTVRVAQSCSCRRRGLYVHACTSLLSSLVIQCALDCTT